MIILISILGYKRPSETYQLALEVTRQVKETIHKDVVFDFEIRIDGAGCYNEIKNSPDLIQECWYICELNSHCGIHLAPMSLYSYHKIKCHDYILHLDDDLVLGKNYIDTVISALKAAKEKYDEVSLISSSIDISNESDDKSKIYRGITQWSNVLISTKYMDMFRNMGWFQFYWEHMLHKKYDMVETFAAAMLSTTEWSGAGRTYSTLHRQHLKNQDIFQNIFVDCYNLVALVIHAPRCTLLPRFDNSLTPELYQERIYKPSDIVNELTTEFNIL